MGLWLELVPNCSPGWNWSHLPKRYWSLSHLFPLHKTSLQGPTTNPPTTLQKSHTILLPRYRSMMINTDNNHFSFYSVCPSLRPWLENVTDWLLMVSCEVPFGALRWHFPPPTKSKADVYHLLLHLLLHFLPTDLIISKIEPKLSIPCHPDFRTWSKLSLFLELLVPSSIRLILDRLIQIIYFTWENRNWRPTNGSLNCANRYNSLVRNCLMFQTHKLISSYLLVKQI